MEHLSRYFVCVFNELNLAFVNLFLILQLVLYKAVTIAKLKGQ